MTTTNLATPLPQSPNPNIPQRQATIPEHDVWVSASAGSGKTKVLTDRVLRLLLPDPAGRWGGAAPHKILCITFTKAAAALMALRVQNKLGEWAVMDEVKLTAELTKLLDTPPSEDVIKAARKLFSTVLDTTGGMSIMTIHAFCQSTLGRFAIEAGVTPGFTVLEESRANDILRHIVDHLITEVEQNKNPAIKNAFTCIATYMDLDSLRDTLLNMMSKAREITEFMKGNASVETQLLKELDYKPNFTPQLNKDHLLHIARIFTDKGGAKEKGYGQAIADWLALNAEDQLVKLDMLQNAFLTKSEKTPFKLTKAVADNHPEVDVMRNAALEQIDTYLDNLAIARQAEQTSDLLQIVDFCMSRYAARKKELNALDFNDLILKTRTLLESENMDWVQFKLDEGIDHILVDEAQDTNIHQWEIIRHLSDEFLSGQGDDTRLRSLFVVGDEKQSIFSFHGADPEAFNTMRDFFEARSIASQRIFKKIPLETSFRSALPVLQLVDAVFENRELAGRIGIPPAQNLVHFAYRNEAAGLVEIWEPEVIDKPDTRNQSIEWKIPPLSTNRQGQEGEVSTTSPLAGKIANTISCWLKNGEMLASENRKIEPRDILILVRTRTSFVPDLVRQLKLRGVPVSGIDRMKLTDQIAVLDCLALAKFARFPEDDLSLACLLRSPFIRLTEDQLMDCALGRAGTLWDSVQAKCDQNIVEWLRRAIIRSHTEKPFDFFDDMLNGVCPFDQTQSGWHAFASCLGADCIDPLDEFLSYCLSKEADGVFSLEELMMLLQASEIEIKRDTEDGDKDSLNQVRIMTVHASKGLEAPIVFLPDTMGVPSKGKIDALQWIKTKGNAPDTPLWAAKTGDGCAAYRTLKDATYDRTLSEHMRLLYVALTRPRDRLYVMGETSTLNLKDHCWYLHIYNAFQKLPHTRVENGLRYETTQTNGADKKEDVKPEIIKAPLPDWIFEKVEDDRTQKLLTIQPSRMGIEDDRAKSPLDDQAANRFKRGTLTHKLFQILPDLPVAGRERAAQSFLARMGKELPEAVRAEIIDETLRILNDPVFADVFGEQSLAEVPVSGDLGDGRMISGQIDRLVIGHNKILIVDFKTNRPSPRDQNAIPEAYKNQLRAYKTAVLRIFPDREILCALLWTDQPLLMPVSI